MTIDDHLAELRSIADRLDHTASLRRRDPGRWLEERDELANELRRIIGRIAKQLGVDRYRGVKAPEHQRLGRSSASTRQFLPGTRSAPDS